MCADYSIFLVTHSGRILRTCHLHLNLPKLQVKILKFSGQRSIGITYCGREYYEPGMFLKKFEQYTVCLSMRCSCLMFERKQICTGVDIYVRTGILWKCVKIR